MNTKIVLSYALVIKYNVLAEDVENVYPNGKYLVNANSALITQLNINNEPYIHDLMDEVAKQA
jgi:hypothetical protein